MSLFPIAVHRSFYDKKGKNYPCELRGGITESGGMAEVFRESGGIAEVLERVVVSRRY